MLVRPGHSANCGSLVRGGGFEPPQVAPLAPQASASTDSAILACFKFPSIAAGILDVKRNHHPLRGPVGKVLTFGDLGHDDEEEHQLQRWALTNLQGWVVYLTDDLKSFYSMT